ncbi:hypothetical protein J6590_069645 [Homalodisca vitripennis]|nr:hypothetical protein J6590_069645 [Homalodisca vitripennis]
MEEGRKRVEGVAGGRGHITKCVMKEGRRRVEGVAGGRGHITKCVMKEGRRRVEGVAGGRGHIIKCVMKEGRRRVEGVAGGRGNITKKVCDGGRTKKSGRSGWSKRRYFKGQPSENKTKISEVRMFNVHFSQLHFTFRLVQLPVTRALVIRTSFHLGYTGWPL